MKKIMLFVLFFAGCKMVAMQDVEQLTNLKSDVLSLLLGDIFENKQAILKKIRKYAEVGWRC